MRKSCVQAVKILYKDLEVAHILCANTYGIVAALSTIHRSSTQYIHINPTRFPLPERTHNTPLTNYLSPLSTHPITTTTKYIYSY
jgi:hypothetical protein